MHAKVFEQSLLLIHSGLQFGAVPMKSGKQEHDGESLFTWHRALGPQGDGWHGFFGSSYTSADEKMRTDLFSHKIGTDSSSKSIHTDQRASYEWISGITRWAAANRIVVNDLTASWYSACSRTRISTLLINTRFVLSTVSTNNTFWSTRWRIADKSCHASAYSLVVYFLASTIGTTWWWIARMLFFRHCQINLS